MIFIKFILDISCNEHELWEDPTHGLFILIAKKVTSQQNDEGQVLFFFRFNFSVVMNKLFVRILTLMEIWEQCFSKMFVFLAQLILVLRDKIAIKIRHFI